MFFVRKDKSLPLLGRLFDYKYNYIYNYSDKLSISLSR